MASVTSHSQKNKSSLSLNNHHILNNSINSDSKLRNDTPQSIPLADLDGEMQISNLSLASSKSYSKSLQSIQSYNGSIKVRNIFFIQLRGNQKDFNFQLHHRFSKFEVPVVWRKGRNKKGNRFELTSQLCYYNCQDSKK